MKRVNFEEQLGWILMDFKQGKLNFSEATLKIEELIVHCLGINVFIFKKFEELVDWAKKNKT